MKKQIFLVFLFILFYAHISSAEILKYKTYVKGLFTGSIYFKVGKDRLEVKGETQGLAKIFYKYNFLFITYKKTYVLYEKEGKKERIYRNEDIQKKKPWLPLLANFFISDKKKFEKLDGKSIKLNDNIIDIKIEEKNKEIIYIFMPRKGKTKKVKFFVKKGEKYPYKIELYGKLEIELKLKSVEPDPIEETAKGN
jgi:hypothetical protein